MKKKLLKSLALSFLLIVVGCSSTVSSLNSVSKEDVINFLTKLNETDELLVVAGETLNENNEFNVTLVNHRESTVEDIKKLIANTLIENDKIKAVDINKITDNRYSVKSVTEPVVYSIILEAIDGYDIGNYSVVNIKVLASDINQWKKLPVSATSFKAAIKSALESFYIGDIKIYLSNSDITFDATGDYGIVIVKIDLFNELENGDKKQTLAEEALNSRFSKIKEKLYNLGIILPNSSFEKYKANNVYLSTETPAEELALVKLDNTGNAFGSSLGAILNTIEIRLRAGGNWTKSN